MIENLRTVSLVNDHNLVIIPGWHVTVSSDNVFVNKLGSIPRKSANLKYNPPHPYYLMSASLRKEQVVKDVPISTENEVIYKEKTRKEPLTILSIAPQPDNKFYYCFFLNDDEEISFSPEFSVYKDEWEKSIRAPHRYVRMVYASLPVDVPLVVDNRKVICISPF